MVAKEIIGDIIKSHIKASNYSQKEVSLLTKINPDTLSKLINGKITITAALSSKISSAFEGLKNDKLILYKIYLELQESEAYNKQDLAILNLVPSLELVSSASKINILRKNIDGGSFSKFEKIILNKSISFAKYKNKPAAKLWLILMYKKYKSLFNDQTFKKSSKKTVYKNVFKTFFVLNKDINDRITTIQTQLWKHGIILRNGPFFPNSSVRGISFVKNTSRFIFLSDMFKREYRWLIALIHELVHFYENFSSEQKIENYAISLIKNYISKNNIKDSDFDAFFSLYDDQFLIKEKGAYFNQLHQSTTRTLSFGDPNDLFALLDR